MEHICISDIRTYLRFEIESFQDDEMYDDAFLLISFISSEFFLSFLAEEELRRNIKTDSFESQIDFLRQI